MMDELTKLLSDLESTLVQMREAERTLEAQLAEQRVQRIAQEGAVQGLRIAIWRLQSLETSSERNGDER